MSKKKIVGIIVSSIVGGTAVATWIMKKKAKKTTYKAESVKAIPTRKMGFYDKYVKRAIDIVCASAAIICFSPLYIGVAILVKLKLGSPVLFTQDRPGLTGEDGKETIFKMYKFRTMTDERDENGDLLPDDVRLTKFGKWLRNTSLDELPEAFNILNGTMSVIGPRPQLVRDMVFMDEKQRMRHTYGLPFEAEWYDVSIKEYRLNQIEELVGKQEGSTWKFIKGSIADKALINRIFAEDKPAVVVNLAAQAGVRYSITNPDVYIESNLIGFYNILEACRHSYDDGANGVEHLVYASSSSVYGSNKKVPYATEDKVDNPVSLYAATKKSNELMAHAYSKLYNIPSTGLRFFTVYGPAGRPDMAYFGFTNKLRAGDTIQIFNYGNCKRDFTYVDDIVEGVKRVMQAAPEKKNGEDGLPIPPYAVYNIGNSHPENLLEFVDILQQELISAGVLPEDYDFDAHKKLVPMQPGDVPVTYADTTALEEDFGFKPQTSLREGLRKFAQWYAEFYK